MSLCRSATIAWTISTDRIDDSEKETGDGGTIGSAVLEQSNTNINFFKLNSYLKREFGTGKRQSQLVGTQKLGIVWVLDQLIHWPTQTKSQLFKNPNIA